MLMPATVLQSLQRIMPTLRQRLLLLQEHRNELPGLPRHLLTGTRLLHFVPAHELPYKRPIRPHLHVHSLHPVDDRHVRRLMRRYFVYVPDAVLVLRVPLW